MATDYLLTPSVDVAPITFTPTTSAYSGTISLTASGNITSSSTPGLSGTSTTNIYSLKFLLSSSRAEGLSANPNEINLSIGSSIGNVNVQGKLAGATFTPTTSSALFTIKFNDANFKTTTINVSANKSSAAVVGDSVIDNPLISLPGVQGQTETYDNLSSDNVWFRTVGRQVRLRQGYEA